LILLIIIYTSSQNVLFEDQLLIDGMLPKPTVYPSRTSGRTVIG